jgi:hypothetical protein
MFKSLLLLSVLLSSTALFSQEVDPNLEISHIEITEVKADKTVVELPKAPTTPLDEIAMYVDGLIAIGKKIWPIIEAGKPVINVTGMAQAMSVLPSMDGTFTNAQFTKMANWSAPKVGSYRVSFKNFYNVEVAGFTYTIYFQHNGTYQEKGKYITNLRIQASEVSAAWGFDFDASSELIGVSNVGTTENPVASAIVKVAYTTKGLNTRRYEQSIYVDGAGTLKPLQ